MMHEKHPRQNVLREDPSSRLIINILRPFIPYLIYRSLPENRPVAKETADFLLRSANFHVRFLKPAAEKIEPRSYASKMESTFITLFCDIFDIEIDALKNLPPEVFKGITHITTLWRTYDDVADEKLIDQNEVTEEMMDETPVFNKYLKREVTGSETLRLLDECIEKICSDSNPVVTQRKTKIWEAIYALRQTWVKTVNNPRYQGGNVLKYEDALDSKRFLTGGVCEISAQLFALLFDNEGKWSEEVTRTGIKLGRDVLFTMQFGDDLIDLRKDWLRDIKDRKKNVNIRPVENLFLVTLEQFPEEKTVLKKYLKSKRKTLKLVQQYAPKTYELYKERFEEQLALLPEHKYKEKLVRFMRFSFNNILPKLPESGPIYKWGKW